MPDAVGSIYIDVLCIPSKEACFKVSKPDCYLIVSFRCVAHYSYPVSGKLKKPRMPGLCDRSSWKQGLMNCFCALPRYGQRYRHWSSLSLA